MPTPKPSYSFLLVIVLFEALSVSCNRTYNTGGTTKNTSFAKRDSARHFSLFDPPFIGIDNSSLKTPSVIYYDEGVAVIPNTIQEVVYVVIADSGKNYYKLKREMKLIRKTLNIKINIGGCYYDRKNRSVSSPGEFYLPRHWPTDFLSIENYSDYDSASAHTMALVAGVYAADNKGKSDSLVTALRYLGYKSFVRRFENYYM